MSEVKLDKLTGVTTAGSIAVTGEGNGTTTNLQQGLLKAWTVNASSSAGTVGDSFNNSSFSDDGTGQTTVTLTNPMNTATDWCITQGALLQYPYKSSAETSTTHSLDTVSGAGNFANGSSNGMCSGDLA